MAYNNYYPMWSPQWYGQQFYQPVQQPMQMSPTQMSGTNQPMQTASQPNLPTLQQGVFVRVPSEQEARNYPVSPGNSVTFIDENAPFCYVKAVDASALDRPRFERYRLVKEDEPKPEEKKAEAPQFALAADVDVLAKRICAIEAKMKKEVKNDEPSDE